MRTTTECSSALLNKHRAKSQVLFGLLKYNLWQIERTSKKNGRTCLFGINKLKRRVIKWTATKEKSVYCRNWNKYGLFLPRGQSQAPACDGSAYQFPAVGKSTNPPPGGLPIWNWTKRLHWDNNLFELKVEHSYTRVVFISNYIFCDYSPVLWSAIIVLFHSNWVCTGD